MQKCLKINVLAKRVDKKRQRRENFNGKVATTRSELLESAAWLTIKVINQLRFDDIPYKHVGVLFMMIYDNHHTFHRLKNGIKVLKHRERE